MENFDVSGLGKNVRRGLKRLGFDTPTEIQARLIPVMLEGRDVVGIARTGTGKTAAFALPILSELDPKRDMAGKGFARALVLVPTRELALQVTQAIRDMGNFVNPRLAVIVGGAKPGPQIKAMERGVDIVVATPGRLEDHMRAGVIDLSRTYHVVLDEADQMMDMGFIPAVRRIMGSVAQHRQTALLSATMPKDIRALADEFLSDPVEVAVAPPASTVAAVHQSVMHVKGPEKRDVLLGLLGEAGPDARSIVFTRTKRGADKLSDHLVKYGLKAVAIHGNRTQGQREKALRNFKTGQAHVLVATDVAARGIDIDDVSHVVNFELPHQPESYVHRIGRTGRAGRDGIAISLCAGGEEVAHLRAIEKTIGMTLEATGEPEEAPQKPPKKRSARNRPPGSARGTFHGRGGGSADGEKPAGNPNPSSRYKRKSKPGGKGGNRSNARPDGGQSPQRASA